MKSFMDACSNLKPHILSNALLPNDGIHKNKMWVLLLLFLHFDFLLALVIIFINLLKALGCFQKPEVQKKVKKMQQDLTHTKRAHMGVSLRY